MARQKQSARKVKYVKSGEVFIPGTPFHMYKQERMAANPRLQKSAILADWQKMTENQVNKYKNKLDALKAAAAAEKNGGTVQPVDSSSSSAPENGNEDADASFAKVEVVVESGSAEGEAEGLGK